MNHSCRTPAIATVLLSLCCTSFGDERAQAAHRSTPYVGVYQVAVNSVAFDPLRCPDASHPFLFTAAGSVQTTRGSGKLTQSHCEGEAGSSFVRGLQTITFHDGFELSGTYEGQLIATPTTRVDGMLMIRGSYRNSAGTGPLSKANGEGISSGTVDTRTGIAVIAVSGTL